MVANRPLDLIQRQPKPKEPDKALACYGAVDAETERVYLYFCGGCPNSDHSVVMLQRLLDIGRAAGKKVVAVIWDNASWHKSKQVRRWIRTHNRQAKQEGDVRLLVFRLPTKSPWLTRRVVCD